MFGRWKKRDRRERWDKCLVDGIRGKMFGRWEKCLVDGKKRDKRDNFSGWQFA